MNSYLYIIAIIASLIGYTIILIDKLKRKKENNKIGFELAKEITSDYTNINIVESKENLISKYHLKRKVIRLTPKMYESKDTFSHAMITLLSCISMLKNKYIETWEKVFKTIDYINKSPLLILTITYFIHTKTDAKIGIILGTLILIYQYYYLQIIGESLELSKEKLKKKDNYLSIINHLYKANKIFFISTLICLLKMITILID